MQSVQSSGLLQLQQQARLCLQQPAQLGHCPGKVLSSSKWFGGKKMGGSVVMRDDLGSRGRRRGGGAGLQVVSMARERRVKMVSQQIKREISEMLLYDNVLQAAVLPETALGADMYLTAVATISEVEVTNDLSVAKVYISIFGDERGQRKALEGLKNKSGYVRKILAQQMNLKHTPEIRFIKDEALERGSRVISILDKLKRERELKEGKGSVEGANSESDQEGSQEIDVDHINEAKIPSRSSSKPKVGEEDDSDWEDDENITFIE